jgi:hypothetical protein
VVVGLLGFLPVYFCKEQSAYTMGEVAKASNQLTSAFGKVYKMNEFVNLHPGGMDSIRYFMGQDGSRLFPRLPPSVLPEICLNLDITQDSAPVCTDLTTVDTLRNVLCHQSTVGLYSNSSVWSRLESYFAGDLVFEDYQFRENGFGDENRQYILIDTSVYDVTSYIDPLRDDRTGVVSADPNHQSAYLDKSLHLLIVNKVNEDATELYHEIFQKAEYKK